MIDDFEIAPLDDSDKHEFNAELWAGWDEEVKAKEGQLDKEVLAKGIKLTAASKFRLRKTFWTWDGRAPRGAITLVGGREGIGKSLFTVWLAAQLTKGELAGDFEGEPRGVAIIANEDSWSRTIAPRLVAAGADLDRVFHVSAVTEGEFGEHKVVLPKHISQLKEAARDKGLAAIICDPLISIVDPKLSANQAQELRMALEPLQQMAEATDLSVFGLIHLNKTRDVDIASMFVGSRAFVEVARAALAMVRDKEENRLLLGQVKNNLGRLDLPTLTWHTKVREVETEDGPCEYPYLIRGDDSDVDVEDVVNKKPGRPVEAKHHEIVEFVLSASRPVVTAEVHKAIGGPYESVKKTLQRAASKGEIKVHKFGTYCAP